MLVAIAAFGDHPSLARFLEMFKGAFLILYFFPLFAINHTIFPEVAHPGITIVSLIISSLFWGVIFSLGYQSILHIKAKKQQNLANLRRPLKVALVIANIILILYFVSGLFAYIENEQEIKDKSAIDALYIKFEGYIREQDFMSAYNLMIPSYREHHSLESFSYLFGSFLADDAYRLHPQRSLSFSKNSKAWLFPKDTSQPGSWHGITFEFEKINGKWYLTGNTALYTD